MSDDNCPDFDQTLRNMLSMPPVPHKRSGEHDDASEDVQTPEDEAQGD
jgi:hypothetical protein